MNNDIIDVAEFGVESVCRRYVLYEKSVSRVFADLRVLFVLILRNQGWPEDEVGVPSTSLTPIVEHFGQIAFIFPRHMVVVNPDKRYTMVYVPERVSEDAIAVWCEILKRGISDKALRSNFASILHADTGFTYRELLVFRSNRKYYALYDREIYPIPRVDLRRLSLKKRDELLSSVQMMALAKVNERKEE
ncbi:MAG: hypothetical protein QXT73_01245 [Candidatus Methanomethylicaceae archaeon]